MASTAGRCAVILYLLHSAVSQAVADSAGLTFSSNPVYAGMPVTLTCNYGPGVLLSVTVDAFNGTSKLGYLWCGVQANTTTDVGVFRNSSFIGCPSLSGGATSVSVTLMARPSLELDYNCSATKVDGSTVSSPTSGRVALQIYVCPLPLKFLPSLLVFNDSDNATVSCVSRNGKPAASVSLTVTNSTGSTLAAASGSDSASWDQLSSLADWHNATATCRVINHNCPNSNITSIVIVNHIKINGQPAVVHTNESNTTLDCSSYITSYPGVRYNWTVPPEGNLTDGSYLNGPLFSVSQGQSGLFNCTATNIITQKSVTIVFIVSNTVPSTTTVMPTQQPPKPLWIIGLVAGIAVIVAVAVVLGVLYKRGHFSKGRKPGVEPSGTDQRSDNGSRHGSLLYVYDGPEANWKTSTEHRKDAEAHELVDRRAQASDEAASRKGRAPSTRDVPANDHESEDIRRSNRLLIATEGIVTQLSQRVLRTTAIVEYSDRSCSLNNILEKIEQAVLQSPRKFKSVALLLRPAKVGLTISEVDHAVLTASSIQEEKGEKVLDFMVRLADLCIDKNYGDARIDILNYNGKAPMRLKKGLADLVKITATVSNDPYGVGTPTGENRGHATVADTYFDSNNLGEIVYAVLEQSTRNPQIQSRKMDEPVIYTEIKGKV